MNTNMIDKYTSSSPTADSESDLIPLLEVDVLESYEEDEEEAGVNLIPDDEVLALEDEIYVGHGLTSLAGPGTAPLCVTLALDDFDDQYAATSGAHVVSDQAIEATQSTAATQPSQATQAAVDIIEAVDSAPVKTDETVKPVDPTLTPDGRVILRHQASEIRRSRSIVLESLAKTGKVFEQGGTIVSLKIDSVTGEAKFEGLNSAQLVLAVDEVVAWERFDARKQGFVRTAPPETFCSALLRTDVTGALPALAGIVQQPFMRFDGTVCTMAGYDPGSRLYGAFEAADWSGMEHPTQEDARAALERLDGLLEEFHFVDPVDRAAALSAMLTAAVRPGLPTAPMFLVRAHVPGSGKSYLCSLITEIASPRRGAPLAFPGSEDECEKVLLAEFRRGSAVIEFDNLTRDLQPYKKLCTALTSERISGRVLGTSRTIELSTRALMLANGNNVDPVGDLARRCITIRLDAATERPAERRFHQPNLLEVMRQKRHEYVAAALTVTRAWLAAGMPKADCTEQGSFNRWSDWCRHPLVWLGQPDPVASMKVAHQEDPMRVLLGRLLAIWHERAGSAPVMVRNLLAWGSEECPAADDEPGLAEVLDEIAGERSGEVNSRRLGRWLKAHAGHIVGGLKLQRFPRRLNAETWQVVKAV